MSVHVVLGAQWGDEGKGKIVHYLSQDYDVVARYQGGANAGHTIVINGQEFVFHLVPSGILHPSKTCVIGNGCVIDPLLLFKEIDAIEKMGLSPQDRLKIAYNAHMVTPVHKAEDCFLENQRGNKIGTTARGIGPTYTSKTIRSGFRMVDILDFKKFSQTFSTFTQQWEKNRPNQKIEISEWLDTLHSILPSYKKMIMDTQKFLIQSIQSKQKILAEGAQGALLDLDHGTYPFVTSSNPSIGGVIVGLGIPPQAISRVTGVLKTYVTRVGEGPIPTELNDADNEKMRQIGMEYGATTGRPRRCGWFDGIAANYVAKLNGLTDIAITKLDILDSYDEIKVCTNYGPYVDSFPVAIQNSENIKPNYDTLPGWNDSTAGETKFYNLPENAKNYISYLENLLGMNASFVSTGSEFSHIIER